MNETLEIELTRIYRKEQIPEFEMGRVEVEEIIGLQEAIDRGFIRLATKKVPAVIPPKFPGKPLSEYLREIRE